MASRASLVAVNRMVRAGGLDETGAEAALIEHARNLARMLDKDSSGSPPLNLLRLYDSALGKLQRAVDRKASAKPVRDAGETAATEPDGKPDLRIVDDPPADALQSFRLDHLGAHAS